MRITLARKARLERAHPDRESVTDWATVWETLACPIRVVVRRSWPELAVHGVRLDHFPGDATSPQP
jgi:hypothetical protein